MGFPYRRCASTRPSVARASRASREGPSTIDSILSRIRSGLHPQVRENRPRRRGFWLSSVQLARSVISSRDVDLLIVVVVAVVVGPLGAGQGTGVAQVETLLVALGVAQVGVRVVLVRQGLLAGAARRQQLALLVVAPLHAPVLEPDLHLQQ